MSASPIARQAAQPQGQAIPRRILINDASQLPHDYSSTPNGTLYSTTPGGILNEVCLSNNTFVSSFTEYLV